MTNSEYFCPVPKDQRPLNEYKKLKESNNFLWSIKDQNTYIKSLSSILVTSSLFSYLLLILSSFSVTNSNYLLLYSVLSGFVITTLICLRSYLGWKYIYSRLMEATVPYEESGWYDGQVWIKPPEILLQDRLIGTYEIYPGISRLQVTLISLFSLLLLSLILLKNT